MSCEDNESTHLPVVTRSTTIGRSLTPTILRLEICLRLCKDSIRDTLQKDMNLCVNLSEQFLDRIIDQRPHQRPRPVRHPHENRSLMLTDLWCSYAIICISFNTQTSQFTTKSRLILDVQNRCYVVISKIFSLQIGVLIEQIMNVECPFDNRPHRTGHKICCDERQHILPMISEIFDYVPVITKYYKNTCDDQR